MREKIELLAPAGDFESFKMAVEYGANALYIGGRNFSARQNASNFNDTEMETAMDYAHLRDVKVYVAMNTLLKDDELDEAVAQCRKAYLMGADGVIIQDAGFAARVRRELPMLNMHASTQMTVFDKEGILKCVGDGFKRVVLARELSLERIKEICENFNSEGISQQENKQKNIETEIFVHGALCISYSGQCLLSSFIGGRSGNRGMCAQPCRLKYGLFEKNHEKLKDGTVKKENLKKVKEGYLLSPKDLCVIKILPDIIKSGVTSLKIEGRMKSPEYTGIVVSIYRKYINMAYASIHAKKESEYHVEEEDYKKLLQIFNRGGFSNGYYLGKTGKDIIFQESPKNEGLFLGIVKSYDRKKKLVKIRIHEHIALGDGIEIYNENLSKSMDVRHNTHGQYQGIYASGIISCIIENGKNVRNAVAGKIVEIGDIRADRKRFNVDSDITASMKCRKTSDKIMNEEIYHPVKRGKFLKRLRISGEIDVLAGEKLSLRVWDTDLHGKKRNEFIWQGEAAVESDAHPITEEKIKEQINKTKDTPFDFEKITVNTDGKSFIPISALNSVRRNAIEGYGNSKIKGNKPGVSNIETNAADGMDVTAGIDTTGTCEKRYEWSVCLYNHNLLTEYDFNEFSRIYLYPEAWKDPDISKRIAFLRKKGKKVYAQIPLVDAANGKINFNIVETDGFLVPNPGTIHKIREANNDIDIMCDYHFNIFNSGSIQKVLETGCEKFTLSPELSGEDIKALAIPKGAEPECIIYGRIPVMNLAYCPAVTNTGENKCKMRCRGRSYVLRDRMSVDLPVIPRPVSCGSMILSGKRIELKDCHDDSLNTNKTGTGAKEMMCALSGKGIKTFRFCFYDESLKEMKEAVKKFIR